MTLLDLLSPVSEFLTANYVVILAFLHGLLLGRLWGFRETLDAIENHQNTLRKTTQLFGHFKGAVEVLDENDLTDEAAERGNRYAQEYLIDLENHARNPPTALDRLRDRFSS